MVAFAVARVAKLKTLAAIRGVGGHNARTRNTPSADQARGSENRTLRNGGADLGQAVMARIAAAEVKPRKGAVLAMELLLSASPEYFRPKDLSRAGQWDQRRLSAWAAAAEQWLLSQYGNRVIDARIHLDESTPHLQAVIVPLTTDGRLSARDLFGRNQLRALQTGYAQAMQHLGIQRGIRGSQAKHTSIHQFYRAAMAPLPTPPEPVQPLSIEAPPPMVREQTRAEWAADQTAKAKRMAEEETVKQRRQMKPFAQKARAVELMQRKVREMQNTIASLAAERDEAQEAARKAEAAILRDLALERVATTFGLEQDKGGRWKGNGHDIKIEDRKWFDAGGTDLQQGRGAIDLVKHLLGTGYEQAVGWLRDKIGAYPATQAHAAAAVEAAQEAVKAAPAFVFQLPTAEPIGWHKVRRYLVEERGLDVRMIDELHKRGRIYADEKNNAAFVMTSAGGKAGGAELRGTIKSAGKAFKGCAKGTSRNDTAFAMKNGTGAARKVILVESAIDALSYLQTHPAGDYIVASSAGARGTVPSWLSSALRGSPTAEVAIAFDRDEPGNQSAAKMLRALKDMGATAVREAPPSPSKDWNDLIIRTTRPPAPPAVLSIRPGNISARPKAASFPDPLADPSDLDRGPGF